MAAAFTTDPSKLDGRLAKKGPKSLLKIWVKHDIPFPDFKVFGRWGKKQLALDYGCARALPLLEHRGLRFRRPGVPWGRVLRTSE